MSQWHGDNGSDSVFTSETSRKRARHPSVQTKIEGFCRFFFVLHFQIRCAESNFDMIALFASTARSLVISPGERLKIGQGCSPACAQFAARKSSIAAYGQQSTHSKGPESGLLSQSS